MECKSLRESGEELKKFDIVYFGASCDTEEKNKEFAEKLELDYPLLSDTSKEVAKSHGILIRNRFSNRTTIIVDKSGKIVHIEDKVNVRNAGKQLVEILEKLEVPKKKSDD